MKKKWYWVIGIVIIIIILLFLISLPILPLGDGGYCFSDIQCLIFGWQACLPEDDSILGICWIFSVPNPETYLKHYYNISR